jgi:hypothetical protein
VRPAVLALVLAVLALAGCRGIGTSRGEMTPPGQIASGAKVSEATPPKVVVDRECSKLEDREDEYVCLKNQDSRPADMGSWVIRNVMGRSYNFPPGFTLPPGATVKLHTGPGSDSASDLYWDYRVKPAWETIDKLILLNNENVEVFISEAKR